MHFSVISGRRCDDGRDNANLSDTYLHIVNFKNKACIGVIHIFHSHGQDIGHCDNMFKSNVFCCLEVGE